MDRYGERKRERDNITYLFTPKTHAIAINSAKPTKRSGIVPANWSNSSNKYTPLPRTKGKVTK